jgi:hypothetical protein
VTAQDKAYLLRAGEVIGRCNSLDPDVLERIAALPYEDSLVEGQPADRCLETEEHWLEGSELLRRLAIGCRIISGETKTLMDTQRAVPEFVGKVGNFLQLFEREEGVNISHILHSKMHEELKESLNAVRALYSGGLQPSVKPEEGR